MKRPTLALLMPLLVNAPLVAVTGWRLGRSQHSLSQKPPGERAVDTDMTLSSLRDRSDLPTE